MSEHLSELVTRVEAEQPGLDIDILLSYLSYRYCKEDRRMLRDEAYIINTRNGATTSIPLRYRLVAKEVIYWLCLELGVNMPDEFAAYQQLMDGAKPADFQAK